MDIVFDLGGVVVDWNPLRLVAAHFSDAAEGARVLEQLVGHRDWQELDRGTLTVDEAIERGAVRCGVEPAALERFFAALPAALLPIPATIQLTQQLKAQGHRLFVLSNMQLAPMHYLESNYPIWDVFEGAVVSSRIQLIKPEAEIYGHLIERFALAPGATLFIDDLETNLAAARAAGLLTLRFRDALECTGDLRALGYLPLAAA